jgi:hypothetical protein
MERLDGQGEPSNQGELSGRGVLIERGWRQGSIIQALGVQGSAVHRGEVGLVSVPRDTPSDGRFVVVSQTCDINETMAKEPVVEAFACSVEPSETIRAGYSKSFRWFEVDPNEGLIAHAMHRVDFNKRTLLDLEPMPWPSSEERLSAFERWLRGRAARPAVPDPIVKAFVKPLQDILAAMQKKQPDAFVAFNNAVEEIRIGLPESELPPFDIPVQLLLVGDRLSPEGSTALDLVETRLRDKLHPAKARLLDFRPTTRSRMNVETYLSTVRVEVGYLTYDGDEIVGAPSPLGV